MTIPISKYSATELRGMDKFAGAGFNPHKVVEAIMEPDEPLTITDPTLDPKAMYMLGYVPINFKETIEELQ